MPLITLKRLRDTDEIPTNPDGVIIETRCSPEGDIDEEAEFKSIDVRPGDENAFNRRFVCWCSKEDYEALRHHSFVLPKAKVSAAIIKGHLKFSNEKDIPVLDWGYYSEATKQQAISWYQKMADANDAEGHILLGFCLELGIDGASNKAQAVFHYLAATEQEDVNGYYQLARCLHKGIGIPKDEDAAFENYARAAELGDMNARYIVGRFHPTIEAKIRRSYLKELAENELLNKARRRHVQCMLGEYYASIERNEENSRLAQHFLRLSAYNGGQGAYRSLSDFYKKRNYKGLSRFWEEKYSHSPLHDYERVQDVREHNRMQEVMKKQPQRNDLEAFLIITGNLGVFLSAELGLPTTCMYLIGEYFAEFPVQIDANFSTLAIACQPASQEPRLYAEAKAQIDELRRQYQVYIESPFWKRSHGDRAKALDGLLRYRPFLTQENLIEIVLVLKFQVNFGELSEDDRKHMPAWIGDDEERCWQPFKNRKADAFIEISKNALLKLEPILKQINKAQQEVDFALSSAPSL